jgi:uracil-DNA glycosylase family 4
MRQPGFFTREDLNKRSRGIQKRSASRFTDETLRSLGSAGVKNMNPDAKNPAMPPRGAAEPLVYVLGDSPGPEEDAANKPFIGAAALKLREVIPGWGIKKTRWDNCVRTRLPSNRKKKVPTYEEIECFRNEVVASIEAAKPAVILALGGIPLKWLTGLTQIRAARGKFFPVTVGEHTCWAMVTLHPLFMLKIMDGRESGVPSDEWERLWKRDIERAYEAAEDRDAPEIMTEADVRDGVTHCLTLSSVKSALEHLSDSAQVGWDWETKNLRPYRNDSKILTVAFSNGEDTYSIPIDHPEAPWTKAESAQLKKLIREFLVHGPRFIAHNLPFEMEWAAWWLGTEVFDGAYGCSLNAAFVIDPGPPGDGVAGHSLNDLSIRMFGIDLKKLSPASTMVARLDEVQLTKVLDYCALDAKLSILLWRDKLMPLVFEDDLEQSYQRQIDRIETIVMAQREGMPIDLSVTREFDAKFSKEHEEIEESIRADESVLKYENLHGTFNADSSKDVAVLLADVMGLPGIRKKGSYSTKEEVLLPLVDESPIVGQLLAMRKVQKLQTTYVRRFLPEHPETHLYPDGKLHCTLGISKTRSARLQSEGPNGQNWPKRKNKEIRRQVAVPPGYVLISADQGQIEGRCIGMESKDPAWVQMLWDRYDVHTEWAQKIAGIDDGFARLLEDKPGEARHKSKNGWVFPSFYRGSAKSIIKNLDIRNVEAGLELFEEFWEVFAGVRDWQVNSWRDYLRNGYVRSLTGRVRRGPLSKNMVCNSPPQSDASDITVDAMVRLTNRAYEEDAEFLQAILQIHDDLLFIVPESEQDFAIKAIVEEQLGFKASWLNVPLQVDVEVGRNWAEMEKVGTWHSEEMVST